MKYLAPILVVVGLIFSFTSAQPHDSHHPEHNDWYKELMRPDQPTISCCGLADAYWADEIKVVKGETFVRIEDDRDDALLGRPHIPNGTWVKVPPEKLKHDRGNPTGHGVVFIGYGNIDVVYCYVFGLLS